MSENLATILTDTAEKHGDRTALKLDDTELSYEFLDGATKHLVGLLEEQGLRARRPGRDHAPQRPVLRRRSTTACCAPAGPSCR